MDGGNYQLPDMPTKAKPQPSVVDLPDMPKKAGGAGSPHNFHAGDNPTPQDIQTRQSLKDAGNGLGQSKNGSKTSQPTQDKGSWWNLPTVIERQAFKGFGEDMGNAFGFLKDKLSYLPGMAGVGAKETMGGTQDFLKKGVEKDKQVLAQNPLPNTTMGHVANTVAGMTSDIGELFLTPEFKLGKVAKLGKYGQKVAEMAIGKFPLQQATKDMLQSYSDAKDKGEDPDLAALKGFAHGYKNGIIFEGASAGAGKLTEAGSKALEKVGLMAGNKFVAGAEKRLLHATAQGLTFSAAPILQNAIEGKGTTKDEIQSNLLFGSVTGAVFGAHGEGDKAAAQIVMKKPLIDLHNFINADIEDIHNIHNLHTTAADLQAQSAAHAEEGFKATDPDEKAKSVVQSSLTGKAASIKSVTEAILKDKQAVIDAIPDGIDKQPIIDKINEVHKALDPIEQKKTAIGSQITDIDNKIKEIPKEESDPVKSAENEINLEELIKKKEELNNNLKQLIKDQNKTGGDSKIVNSEEPPVSETKEPKTPEEIDKRLAEIDKELQRPKEDFSGNEKTGRSEQLNNYLPESERRDLEKEKDALLAQKGEPTNSTKEIEQQESGESKHQEGDESRKKSETSGSNNPVGKEEGKPRFKIKGEEVTPLPPHEHTELNNLLKEDGIDVSHLEDVNNEERNPTSDNSQEVGTDAKTVQQPEDDGTRNDGENRQGKGTESTEGTSKEATGEGETKQIDLKSLKKELAEINQKLADSDKDHKKYIPASEKKKLLDRKAEINKLLPQQSVALPLPWLSEFIEHDVKPIVQNIASSTKSALSKAIKIIHPQTGVDLKAKDIITSNINERNEIEANVDKLLNSYEKMFDKMKDDQRIDFIDRIKRGLPQQTKELQDIADAYKQMDKDLYDSINSIKGNAPFKDNHFRVLWKVIPGSTKTRSWFSGGKSPLEGSKGFMKQSTLTDMSEGIAKGGEPISTNPITLFKMAHADAMKFVTAHRMFDALKQDGYVKFFKEKDIKSGNVPDNFVPINDKIARIYFPVETTTINKAGQNVTAIVKAGEWHIEKNAGRMINNLLSQDKLRYTELGKGLLAFKNFTTAVELSLSPYHATAMSLEAMSSDVARGIRKTINQGDVKGGISDILKAPFSPVNTFRLGRKYISLASQKEFESSEFGKQFLAKNPLAKEYLHDFFQGGGLTKQNDAYRLNAYKSLQDQLAKNNYIGAGLRALPMANETIMSPLFNTYIPALKVGIFMKEFPQALKENEKSLASGKTTRAEIARKTINFVDDRLGELNFDNLYWDRTFKTATQLMFRSVTWKLGNARALGGAIPEQGMEFYNAMKEGRNPILKPKMAWMFGLAVTHAVTASLIQYAFTQTLPQNFKDLMWPRTSKDDDKERLSLPDYGKDISSIAMQGNNNLLSKDFRLYKYGGSALAGDVTKMMDVWNNSDFQKYQIYSPNDPIYKQGEDALKYLVPQPIGASQVGKDIKNNTPLSKGLTHFIGFSPAPKYITNTHIENKVFDLYNIQEGIKTKNEKDVSEYKNQIRDLYKSGKFDEADKLIDKGIENGDIKPKEIKYLVNPDDKQSPAVFMFNSLKDDKDKVYLYNQMTEKEKEEFDPKGKVAVLAHKYNKDDTEDYSIKKKK